MRRRDFIKVIAGSAASWPLAVRAQQPTMPVVALVNLRSAEDGVRRADAFRKGLDEAGYVEGQNVTVEYDWLDGRFDRLSSVMADLVRRRVAVIATPAATTLPRRLKLRPQRSPLYSASETTRSDWALSPTLPGRAEMRPVTIFPLLRFRPSVWSFSMRWCRRQFVWPCWSIRRTFQSPRAPCATSPKRRVPWDCKYASSTLVPRTRSRRPSTPSFASRLRPSLSPQIRTSSLSAPNSPRSQCATGFQQPIPLGRMSRPAG